MKIPDSSSPRWEAIAQPIAEFVRTPRAWRELYARFRTVFENEGMHDADALGRNAIAWLDQRHYVAVHDERWRLTRVGTEWLAARTASAAE